jgi:hypothetical protein
MGKQKGKKTLQFRYKQDTMGNHKIFIWVWSTVLLLLYLVCSLYWGVNASAIPFCFLFFVLLYLWARRWESNNEETEKIMAIELMKKHVVGDVHRLYGEDVTISSWGYYCYSMGKDHDSQCLLVYLSNTKIIQYLVRYVPSGEEDVCCCEIELKPIETNDRKLIRKISPHFRPLLYLSPQNEFKVRILFIYIIGLTVIATCIIGMHYYKWIPLASLFGYMLVIGVMGYVCKKMNLPKQSSFFVRRLKNTLRILHFSVPAFDLALVSFLSLIIGLGIPCAIIYVIRNYFDIVLSESVQYFICLVFLSIILVHHDNFVHKYILNFLFKHDYDELKHHPFVEVALNLTQGKNINFLIYLLYFGFLSWTTFARLQGLDPLISPDLIEGATPAFLVHIAYTNMVLRYKEVDLKMDTMMSFMSRAYDIKVL